MAGTHSIPAFAVPYGPERLLDATSKAVRGVACTITVTASGAAATLYNGRERVPLPSNVVNSDHDGNLSFWIDPGSYTITPASGVDAYNVVIGDVAFPAGVVNSYVKTYATPARTIPAATSAAVTQTATVDAPAGGTGATGGAWDTAGHRDTAIATINALRVDMAAVIADNTLLRADVLACRQLIVALVLDLETAGILG